MIAPFLMSDEAIAAYRGVFRAAPMASMLLPGAIDDTTAAALRQTLSDAGVEPFGIADRGRYRCNPSLRVAELWNELGTLAGAIVERPLEIVSGRWLHFGHGDYALTRDDARTRPAGDHVELVLDLSAAATGEAEIVYSDGRAVLTVPQLPGLLALIDRPAAVARYERPITVLSGGGEVVRLRLWLR